MRKVIDLTWEKYGKLTVVRRAAKNDSSGAARWVCHCECGHDNCRQMVVIRGDVLRQCRRSDCGVSLSSPRQKGFSTA